MPRGGHFGGWWPLPKDFFRSRWKRFYKRSYREGIRGRGRNTVDRPAPYPQARTDHDIMPSPWRLQYSARAFEHGKTPPDQRRLAQNMYSHNIKEFMLPYSTCVRNKNADAVARDTILRALDGGRRLKGGDSGFGRAAFLDLDAGSKKEWDTHVPLHLYRMMKSHSGKQLKDKEFFTSLCGEDAAPETFYVRRLYELCEEKELVWEGGQQNRNFQREDAMAKHGRFPRVDESASLVDDLQLKDILRLRHKTARRRHPKWIMIQAQFKRWQAQYERRRQMLKDEVNSRMHILSQSAE